MIKLKCHHWFSFQIQDITRLQKFRLRNQQQQKKFIGSLILYSIILYIIAALILYFVYLPPDWKNRLLFSSPLLVFPVLWVSVYVYSDLNKILVLWDGILVEWNFSSGRRNCFNPTNIYIQVLRGVNFTKFRKMYMYSSKEVFNIKRLDPFVNFS